jgi:hypothetical protein
MAIRHGDVVSSDLCHGGGACTDRCALGIAGIRARWYPEASYLPQPECLLAGTREPCSPLKCRVICPDYAATDGWPTSLPIVLRVPRLRGGPTVVKLAISSDTWSSPELAEFADIDKPGADYLVHLSLKAGQ